MPNCPCSSNLLHWFSLHALVGKVKQSQADLRGVANNNITCWFTMHCGICPPHKKKKFSLCADNTHAFKQASHSTLIFIKRISYWIDIISHKNAWSTAAIVSQHRSIPIFMHEHTCMNLCNTVDNNKVEWKMNKNWWFSSSIVYKDHSEKYSMNFFISYIIMTG